LERNFTLLAFTFLSILHLRLSRQFSPLRFVIVIVKIFHYTRSQLFVAPYSIS